MDKQGMLCKIYEALAPDREMLVCRNCDYLGIDEWRDDAESGYYVCTRCGSEYCDTKRKTVSYIERKQFDDSATIMIGDILDWMETNLDDYYVYGDQYTRGASGQLIEDWKEKRKPIAAQDIKCIKNVYNLLG